MNSAGFDILYEDDTCLVVNKPGGLLTQAPLGIDSLEFQVKKFLKERDALAGDVYLGVPHRLDRPVSGAIVFAKDVRAARRISKQFERRAVEKKYWALVAGEVTPDQATWTDKLKKIEGEPRTIVAEPTDPEGRIAILHYHVLQRLSAPAARDSVADSRRGVTGYAAGRTLLEIQLETGRTHQIRVQCASRGHPLAGDDLYRSMLPFGPWHADERQRLVALHARSLRFQQPTTREYISVIAPLPEYWREAGVAK